MVGVETDEELMLRRNVKRTQRTGPMTLYGKNRRTVDGVGAADLQLCTALERLLD